MKKTIYMLPALALLMLASCSGDDAITKDDTAQLNETPENAIGFDAYLNRTTTRAGAPGILTSSTEDATHVSLQNENIGFGVFGYYANGDLYSENATPNFMYNQHVTYADSKWTYAPVKYWPNEFGSSAISTGVDRVTFFAYAPYVGVDPTTGQLTSIYNDTPGDANANTWTNSGITSLTRNGKSGDPYIRYVGAFNPKHCVDLCYGVAAENFTSTIGASDGANNIKVGEPYLNVAKPEIGGKIYFDFQHALAKLTVQIDADVDIPSHNTSNALDGKTRVWVRSITFDGIAQRGYLNLNSGMWYEVMDNNKISHASVTIHDGRRDGAEAIADDSYESPTGFNTALIQDETYSTTSGQDDNGVTIYKTFSTTKSGVTADYKNLFDGSGSLLVIPANEQLKVTIVYDVETADATLPTYLSDGVTKGSTVENKITKYITLGGNALKLESGNAYTLNLHLGMNSVKFDAKVSGWDETTGAEADLPANVAVYPAPGAAAITLPASTTEYTFAVSGLTANEAVTASGEADPITTATVDNDAANSGGIAIVTLGITQNTGVTKIVKNNAVTITGGSSSKTVTVNLTQNPAPLGLYVEGTNQKTGGSKDIILSSSATSPWASVATPDNTDNSSIIVYKNGTRLTYNNTTPGDATFNWDSSGKIVLGSAATAGDVFTITVKAGDAAAETTSFTAKKQDATISGTINFSPSASVKVGETVTVSITPTTSPDMSSDPGYTVVFSSNEPAVATVNPPTRVSAGTYEIVITGVSAGTCEIIVSATSKNYQTTNLHSKTLTVVNP